MTRAPYILKEEELTILVDGLILRGAQETYDAMFAKVEFAMQNDEYMDEMLMDMHETVLKKARALEEETDFDESFQDALYQVASLLRILAHDIHLRYAKIGKEKGHQRFLHSV